MASKVSTSSSGSKNPDLRQSNSVVASTWNLLNTKRYCDVKFLVGPTKTEILAHKQLLMARSSVFATMFTDRWTFDGNGDSMTVMTIISDADPDIFRLFLRYIYTDHFAPDISKACSLFELADEYDIAPLVTKCDEFISNNFSEEESFEVFQWARRYSLNKLMDKAEVMTGTFEKLLDNDDILKAIDRETLIYLLKRDDLDVAEIQIFIITVKWARIQASSSNQKAEDILKGIIPFIRFPLMNGEDIIYHVVPTKLLPKDDVIALTYSNEYGELRNTMSESIQYSGKRRVFTGRTKVKIKLYNSKGDRQMAHHQNRKYLNAVPVPIFHNKEGYVEEIRFNYNPTGETCQLALLTGLTLKIPDLRTHCNSRHEYESFPSEYFVTIKTECSSYDNCRGGQRMKLLRGVETKVESQQHCELKLGYSYTISVAFGGVPLLNRTSWALEPRVDALNNSIIPHQITQPLDNGSIQLSNVMFIATTDSYRAYRKYSGYRKYKYNGYLGYHAVKVKHLHLQLENSQVEPTREKEWERYIKLQAALCPTTSR